MTYRLRAAKPGDLEHLYEMAKLTGGGFTNLPADRAALTRKLERAQKAFDRKDDAIGDDQFVLILENTETGEVRGDLNAEVTAQIVSLVIDGLIRAKYSGKAVTHPDIEDRLASLLFDGIGA